MISDLRNKDTFSNLAVQLLSNRALSSTSWGLVYE